jgi:hypothetical protein
MLEQNKNWCIFNEVLGMINIIKIKDEVDNDNLRMTFYVSAESVCQQSMSNTRPKRLRTERQFVDGMLSGDLALAVMTTKMLPWPEYQRIPKYVLNADAATPSPRVNIEEEIKIPPPWRNQFNASNSNENKLPAASTFRQYGSLEFRHVPSVDCANADTETLLR